MTVSAVPCIDISGLYGGDAKARSLVDAALLAAAQNTGFMALRGSQFSGDILEEAFTSSRSFFIQADDIKRTLAYRGIQQNHGYVATGQEALDPQAAADHKESFTMRDVARMVADNSAWPSMPFRDAALALYLAARQLAADILAALGRGLDVEPGFFEQRHTGQNQTLRYLHYPASGAGSALPAGAGAHTDYGSITLLWQDGQAGLEVRDAQGRWLPVSADPSQVVVNIGDLLQCWTAGCCQSTLHRVRPAQTGQPRYSIAFFCDPDDAVLIESLPSCVDVESCASAAPLSAGEHITRRLSATY
jgi:isopenicillin N synthase-like dioxygenase